MWHPAGPLAVALADISWVLIAGPAVVFTGVMLLLTAPRRTRRWLLGGGLLFPGVMLAALLVYRAVRSEQLLPASCAVRQAPPPDPRTLVVSITARSWWWGVRYRHPGAASRWCWPPSVTRRWPGR